MLNVNRPALNRIFGKMNAKGSNTRSKGVSIQKKKKEILTLVAAAVTLLMLVTGCSKGTPVDTESPEVTTSGPAIVGELTPGETQGPADTEEVEEEADLEEEFLLLADGLQIQSLRWTNNLTAKVEAEADRIHQQVAPGKVFSPSEVYVDNNDTQWRNQDDATKFEQGPIIEDNNYFLAPNGKLYRNEAEYNAIINNSNGNGNGVGTGNNSSTVDNSSTNAFVETDGTQWGNEAEYRYYTGESPNQINDGRVEVRPGIYRLPDGLIYDSRTDSYYSSLEAYDEIVNPTTTRSYQDTTTYYNDTTTYYEDTTSYNNNTGVGIQNDGRVQIKPGVYQFPDGLIYDSNNDRYYASLKDYEASLGNSTGTGDVITDNNNHQNDVSENYYIAPDGTKWITEQDYWNSIELLNAGKSR